MYIKVDDYAKYIRGDGVVGIVNTLSPRLIKNTKLT